MKKRILINSILWISILLCVGCGKKVDTTDSKEVVIPSKQQSEEVNKPVSDNIIKVAMIPPKTFNPIYMMQVSNQQTMYLLFSPLVNVEVDGSVTPNLAKSWSVNETNTSLMLTLQPDAMWHDGQSVTTQDVVFTIHQIQSATDTPYKQAVENIANVQAIDEKTVQITYRQPFSSILQTLVFPVIPKHIYEMPDSNALDKKPIGSGPYRLKDMIPLKEMTLEANPAYFKGKPKIEHIQVVMVPDEQTSLHAFKQGLLDVVYTDMTEWGKYASTRTSNAYEIPSNTYECMGVNFNQTKFQDPVMRKALLYGIDREKLIHLYYLDHANLTDTPIHPLSYLNADKASTMPYDKEQAKLLLAQVGYTKEKPLSFSLLVNKENIDRVKIAEEIKQMYEEIGVKIKVEIVDRQTYLNRIKSKQFDAFLGGWQLSYATDLSFMLHSSKIQEGQNYVGYKDEKMDQLLGQTFTATNSNIKTNYGKLQAYFKEKNPYISLYFKTQVLITKKKIKGDIKPLPLHMYANVEEWTLE